MSRPNDATNVVPLPLKRPLSSENYLVIDPWDEEVVLGIVGPTDQGSWKALTEAGVHICTVSTFDHAVAEVRDHHLTTGGASER